jgi:GGDEF domain-containing protein
MDTFINKLKSFSDAADSAEQYRCICTSDGLIVYELYSTGFPLWKNANAYDELHRMINNEQKVDEVEKAAKNGLKAGYTVQTSNDTHIVVVGTSELVRGKWFILEVFDPKVLMKAENSLIETFSSLIIIITVLLLLLLIYAITVKYKSMHTIDQYDFVDSALGCPTFKKFTLEAETILSRNRITKFAVIYLKAIHFEYIKANFGETISSSVLRFLAKVLEKILQTDETFGHIMDDKFVMLLHYKQLSDLTDRLNTMNAVIFNCPALKEYNYNMKVSIGIYCIERDKNYSIQKMLDLAMISQESNNRLSETNINVYNEQIQSRFLLAAEIEAKMNNA